MAQMRDMHPRDRPSSPPMSLMLKLRSHRRKSLNHIHKERYHGGGRGNGSQFLSSGPWLSSPRWWAVQSEAQSTTKTTTVLAIATLRVRTKHSPARLQLARHLAVLCRYQLLVHPMAMDLDLPPTVVTGLDRLRWSSRPRPLRLLQANNHQLVHQ